MYNRERKTLKADREVDKEKGQCVCVCVCVKVSYETLFYNVICDFTTCVAGSIYE